MSERRITPEVQAMLDRMYGKPPLRDGLFWLSGLVVCAAVLYFLGWWN